MNEFPAAQPGSRSLLAPPVQVRLVNTGDHACPYLPDRIASNRAFLAERIDPEIYHAFMDAGFRRSGRVVYQPACTGCRACVPIRVPVATFTPSKSQRRCARRNADLVLDVSSAQPTDEKFDLYRRYTMARHRAGDDEPDRAGFESFLYDSPVDTLEFTYRSADKRLLGVGLCDISRRSLSSVYFYFDPSESRRGLGTYGALREISFAREAGIPYYYLGYWIEPCRSMRYKIEFGPCELLHPDGRWRGQ
ncbi:MAG TPA: arginyltransferase [Tepidisphaeraceae bacterium]|nr:arginyltransferase [Tepidisphaeraceae bacterium]